MADGYINLEINLDAQKALQNASEFATGVKGKLGEIDEAAKRTNDIINGGVDFNAETAEMKLRKAVFGNMPIDTPLNPGVFEKVKPVFEGLNTALGSMKDGLASISDVINSGDLTGNMTRLFESMYRTISSGMKKITDYTNSFSQEVMKIDKPIDVSRFIQNDRLRQTQLAAASGMKAAADARYLANLISAGDFGVSRTELNSLIPDIKRYAASKVNFVQSGMRGTGTIDDIAGILSQREDFQNVVRNAAGKKLTVPQLKNIAKLFAASQGYAGQSSKDFLDSVGFDEELKLFQSDYFPDKTYAKAFKGYGNPFSEIQGNANGKDKITGNAYHAIWNLVKNGNQQAIRLAQQVGLVRARNGRYEYTASATQAQMETLAGLAMQSIHDAKSSLPFHYVDPDDIGNEQKIMSRQNKVYQADMEIVEALHKAGISPNVYSGYMGSGSTNIDDIIKRNSAFRFIEEKRVKNGQHKYNKRFVNIGTLGTKDMFVIPQTIYGEEGELLFRDPTWQKENGVKAQAEDHFVTIGRSALTDMLGMTGNNTYGYGRENGKAKYGTPKLFRIDTSGLYEEYTNKDHKLDVRIKEGKEKEAERLNKLFNREITEKYGDEEYIAAYGDETSITMMLKSEYDRINREAKEAGLASPLENMNIGGRFGTSNYSANMKAIDLQKKFATPGHLYSELGYKKSAPLTALVDFTSFYDIAGVPKANQILRKNQRLDGVTFYDPRVMPFNAQMREGLIDKYLGVREDWRQLLSDGGYLKNAFESGENPGLIVKNDKNESGFSFYMPQIGLGPDRVKSLVSRMNYLQRRQNKLSRFNYLSEANKQGLLFDRNDVAELNRLSGDRDILSLQNGLGDKEANILQKIRDTYFYDIMDKKWEGIMSDTAVKNDDKWRISSGENFKTLRRELLDDEQRKVYDELIKQNKTDEAEKILNSVIPAAVKGKQKSEWLIKNKDGSLALNINDNDIVELTAEQQARHLQTAGKKYGLWINNSAEDFSVKKDFIPEQLATSMGIGIKERTASTVAYNEYISALKNDEVAQQEYLASIPLGRLLLASGQHKGSLAQRLIGSRITDMEQQRQEGGIYAPDNDIVIGLTAPKAGSTIGPIFKGLFGTGVDTSTEIGKMIQRTSDENSIIMQTLSDDEISKLKGNALIARMMLSRMPAAPGEYSPDSENLGDIGWVRKAMQRLGMDTRNTVYTDPRLQYRLMTGDYDGDTAWIIRGLSEDRVERMRDIAYKKREAAKLINEQYGEEGLSAPERELSPKTRLTDFQLGDIRSKLEMGTTTAAIRNAMQLSDDDPNKWKTIAQAITEYDFATSESKKKGQSLRMSQTTSDAVMEGALFRRFVKEINSFSNDPEHARAPRIFSARLPLLNEETELADAAFNFKERRTGGTVGDTFGAHLDEWLTETYGNAQTGEAKAARHYAQLMKNITSGKRLNTQADISEGRQIAFNWHNELEERRQAGENVSEELAHWNSYLSRLKSAEEKGATYENIEKRKQNIDNKIRELEGKQNRTKEENNQLSELQGLSDVYGELMVPFSDRMKKVDEEWDIEVQTFRDAVQKRVETNQKAAENRGLDTSHNRGLMNQVFARNPETAAAMNWSDVTPWLYEVLQKEKTAGNHFALSGIKTRNLLTGSNGNHPEEEFNPYPHNELGIEQQRVDIMARELTKNIKGLEQFGYQNTGATLMGTIRHNSFQDYLQQIMQGNLNANISDIYATALQKAGYDGVDLEVENVDGKLVLRGLDSNATLQKGIENALGSFNKDTGLFENGTLDAFAKNIILGTINAGGRIANVEGANYDYWQDSSGNAFIDKKNPIKGRGTPIVFPVKYKDAAGYEHIKEGTFAPDLIMGNANGTFDMYDYKSSEPGSVDSLFQMMVYAGDIKQKANAWRQYQGDKRKSEYEKAKKEGWLQYVDDNGNLKFNGFHGYDTASGTLYDYEITGKNQDIIDTVLAFYHRAQEAKMDSARSGEYQKAIDYIQAQLDAGNIDIQKTKRKGLAERVMQSNGFKTDTYRNYVAQKILKDEDELDEINSFLYKKDRQMNNFDSGGFSPYTAYRQKLDEMVAPGRMEELKKEWGDSPEAQKEIDAYTQRVENMRKRLAEIETEDSLASFKNLRGDLRQMIYGTKDSAALGTIEAIQKKILNAAAVREGMKSNKDLYSFSEQKWISDEAKNKYSESIEEQKKIEDEFANLLPTLTQKQIADNKKTFDSLLPKDKENNAENAIKEYYNKRYDNIQKFIQQQEADIDKYQSALEKTTTVNGKEVEYYTGVQRKAIEDLLKNAKDNRNNATGLLLGGDVESGARKDFEASLGLYSQNTKKKRSQQIDEYANLLRRELDEQITPQLEVAERRNDLDKVAELEAKAQERESDINRITAQSRIQKGIESIEDELVLSGLESMFSGKAQDKETAIKNATLQFKKRREQYIRDQVENEGKDRAWENDFREKYSEEAFEKRLRQEQSIQDDLTYSQTKQREEQLQHQNDMAAEQRRHQYEQMRRNRFGYSRSRIGNAYRQQLDQKWSLDQQVKNNEFYAKQAEESIKLQKDAFEAKYKMSYADFQKLTPEAQKAMGGEALTDAGKISSAQKQMEGYANAAKDAAAQSEQMTGASMAMSAAFQGLSQSLSMVAHRLGRQLFMKALQETKRFVKEFDASMTEIQAITLKSDQEMQGIRSQTINKALGLRTSVSNVANVEAALYRQGLSDQEVSARTESIIKFATVTKLKVEDATKIITTALQNDLVASANEAMDALVALGDSAATTAAEIGKGMQKAAAAAKVAGVSYSELTALLTIGTSDTQLSGTQVGTALQTVFTRMRRLSTTGWAADQNGEKTTANDAEAALKAVGVDLWDDKAVGKMRSAYDVLLDLSKVWQNLSDAQKNIVMNSMAGTRQTNVFATLMEGMSEDNGTTLEKYLGLAEGSEGVTQSKYEIAMQSLAASMDTLRSSWDAVVESFVSGGSITGALDSFSGLLQKLSDAAANGGKIGIVLSGIAAGITAIGVAMSGITGPAGMLLQIIAALGVFGTGAIITSLTTGSSQTQEEVNRSALNDISIVKKNKESESQKRLSLINEVEKAGKAWNDNKSAENTDNLTVALNKLESAFPGVAKEIQDSTQGLNNWTKAVENAKNKADELTQKGTQAVIDKTKDYVSMNLGSDYTQYMDKNFISANKRDSLRTSFKKAVRNFGFGNDLGGAYTIDEILKLSPERRAEAFTQAYRNNYDFKNFADLYITEDLKTILNDKTNDKPWKSGEYQNIASDSLAYVIDNLNTPDTWTLQTSMYDALKFRSDHGIKINPDFFKNDTINLSKLSDKETSDYDKAVILSEALVGSREVYDWLSKQEGGQELINGISYIDNTSGALKLENNAAKNYQEPLARMAERLSSEANSDSKRKATRLFLKEKLPEVLAEDFALMANDKFDVNKVQDLFISSLSEEMETNKAFFNNDGTYNQAEIQTFVDSFLDGWLENTAGFLNEEAKKRFTADKFAYHYDENNVDTWFDDYDKAIDYGIKNGLDLSTLKTSTGASAYQGFEALFKARDIEANANNINNVIDEILYGSEIDISKIGEEYQKKIAHSYAAAINGDQEDVLNKIKTGEIKYDNLPMYLKDIINGIPNLKVKGLSEYGDLSSLYDAYDVAGKSSVLANFVANNANAASAVLLGDMDMFTKAVQEAEQGMSTTSSRADMMKIFGTAFQTGEATNRAEAIKLFRTNGLTSKAYETWQSFFGENADAILTAMASEEGLTGDLLDYYNRTLAEKGIATGTGKQFTNVQTSQLARTVFGIGDWTKAQETSSKRGWTTDEWSALESKYPDLKRYLQMTPDQRASQEGQNLERNIQIQMNVAGINDLEEAGKIAAGTAEELANLQKHGKIEIDVLTKLHSEAIASAQQRELLRNGTATQRAQAAMSLLGINDASLYYANEEENYKRALNVDNANMEQEAQTWWTRYNAKGLTEQQRGAIYNEARAAGFDLARNARQRAYGFKYTGTDLVNVSPLVGTDRTYTDLEKANALQEILVERMSRTVGEGGNSELYDAAVASAGTYTRELLRRKANNEEVDDWLQIASDNERSAYQTQMLTGNSSKLTQAQQAQYAYENFNIDNASNLASFLNMNETDVKRLMSSESGQQELQSKLQEQQKAIYSEFAEGLGITLDMTDMSSMKDQIQTAADNATGIVKEFLQWLADSIDASTGFLSGESGYQSFQDVVSANLKGTIETQAAIGEVGKLIGQENRDYAALLQNKNVNWQSLDQGLLYMLNNRANGGEAFTDQMIDEAYANALYGRKSSPENQQRILNALFGGNTSAENMISTYQSWMNDKEGHAAEIETFNSLDNVESLTEAMTSQENTIEKTTQAIEEYDKQVEVSQTNYMKKYGDRTTEVATKLENLRKSEKSAATELKSMTAAMSSLVNNQYYRQKWLGGDRSSKTKENVAAQLGLQDKKDLEAFSDEEITARLKRLEISDIEDVQVDADAISESMSLSINKALGGQKLTLNGMEVNVDSGSVNLSWDDALSQLNGLLSQEEADFIAMLKAYHIEGSVVVNDTGKGLETHIDITGLGSGRRGVGGGGGGGKSAAQKLIDEWKHKVTEQQHEVTMAGIEAQDAAQANNGGAYLDAINKQISANEKLRDIYEDQIAALTAQMDKVKKGSDDWWSLKETIQSAEEAQAQLNKTIADLNTSKINEITQAYEYMASLAKHQSTLAEINSKRAQQLLSYDAWSASINERVAARRNDTIAAQEALQQIQQQYDKYIAGGGSSTDDTAREFIKQMNTLSETIASESSDIQDILNEQLEIARTQRDTELIVPDYYSTMLDSIISKLDTENNSREQLAAIEAKKIVAQEKIDVYRGSNGILAQQLQEEFDKNGYSQQYYNILKEMYGNLETIAHLEEEIRNATAARLDVITEFFNNRLSQNTHEGNMLKTQQTLLDFYNDYEGRQGNVTSQRNNLAERRTQLQYELNTLTAEQSQYAEGDANWIRTRDEINRVKEELYGIQTQENDLNNIQYNAAKEYFDNMMKPFTHADNMYAIDAERFARLNDYENQNAVIDYQQANIDNRKRVFQETIKEMSRLRAGVDEGSDAWWQYTEAINSAQESLTKLDNEAAKLNAQKLSNLLEQQQNEDKTGNHAYDMLGVIASRALLQEDFDTYYQAQTDKQYNIRDTISQNKKQVAELEELLASYEINSDEWLKTRDEIWKIKKETAQKENEAIQIEQEIARQRLAQITQELNRNSKYEQHRNAMMQNYGTIYQRYGNYEGYRNTINVQMEDWEGIKADTETARAQVLAEMEGLEIGTKEWYDARDAVYAYDEALLRADVEMENLTKARNMSYLQEVADQFNNITQQYNYSLAVVRAAKSKATSRDSYEDYKKYAQQERDILAQQIQSRNAYIEQQKTLMAGFIKDTEEWKQAKQNIINAMMQNVSDQSAIDQADLDMAKSWVDKLFESMDWADSETEHNLNLIQYEQTRYQNRGELTNYGVMLEKENEVRTESIARRKEEIKQLEEEREQLKDNATEYNRITEKIKAKEEAVKADTVAIEENNKKLKENEVAILKTQKSLEDIVVKGMQDIEKHERGILDARVSMEKTIFETIKQRYIDQWDLEKKDISKQKEALQEYKKNLNDRLAARKNAMDIEEKYRQLEEYQQQYALISADPTRTKDAKTLREQIRSLERDIAWDRASESVDAESEAIDNAIQSLDDYVEVHQEDLDSLLADSRNFSDDINLILQGSFESILAWLAENNAAYKGATDELRTQMEDDWRKTWETMADIPEIAWEKVNEILSSMESFVEFMRKTPDFMAESIAGQKIMLADWSEAYKAAADANIKSIEAVNYALHEHDRAEGESEGEGLPDLDLGWLDEIGQEKPAIAANPTPPEVQTYSGVGKNEIEHIVTPGNIETNDTYDHVGTQQTHEDYKPNYIEESTPVTPAAPASVYNFPEADNSGFGGFEFPDMSDIQRQIDGIENPSISSREAVLYSVTWKNGGTILATGSVAKGSTPSYSGATPTKAEDANNTYTFSGWSPTPGPIESDTTYNAQFTAITKQQEQPVAQTPASTGSGRNTSTTKAPKEKHGYEYTVMGSKTWSDSDHSTRITSKESAYEAAISMINSDAKGMLKGGKSQLEVDRYVKLAKANLYYYKTGGLVDYTGPAWVDGTPSQPEAFLSSVDTKMIRSLIDALNHVYVAPSTIPNFDSFNKGDVYGDINITINQAELKDDADIEDVARKVGKAFTKELSKNGFNLSGYNL